MRVRLRWVALALLLVSCRERADTPPRPAYRDELRARLDRCVQGTAGRPDNACVLEVAAALPDRPADRRFRVACEAKAATCASEFMGDLCGPRSRLYQERALDASLGCFERPCGELLACVRRSTDR